MPAARRLSLLRTAPWRATVCLSLALAAPEARALAAARVDCRAERAGQRAVVQVAVTELFDREMLRLVELGLLGRLHLDLVLYRRRRFWFDERLAESSPVYAIAWSKETGRFTLDGQSIASPAAMLALPALTIRPEDEALGADDHYIEVSARLEVITASSLGQVARWLVARPDSPGAAPASTTLLPRALVGYLASDLARTAGGRCEVAP